MKHKDVTFRLVIFRLFACFTHNRLSLKQLTTNQIAANLHRELMNSLPEGPFPYQTFTQRQHHLLLIQLNLGLRGRYKLPTDFEILVVSNSFANERKAVPSSWMRKRDTAQLVSFSTKLYFVTVSRAAKS